MKINWLDRILKYVGKLEKFAKKDSPEIVLFDCWYSWECPKCLSTNYLDEENYKILDLGDCVVVYCQHCGVKVKVERGLTEGLGYG